MSTYVFEPPTIASTSVSISALRSEDASSLFGKTGIISAFEALEGWPVDYATNPASIVKFFRDHHFPSFLEYSEHPYVSCEEIKKALKLKAAFSTALDQMQ
jgi:hypothetical protein